VQASEQHLSQIMEILERHNPIDIDERTASYGLSNSGASRGAISSATASSGVLGRHDGTMPPGGEEVVPLAEERLTVGKRLVNRGTTRVRRFVVETPVEEAVTLHSERVSVDRRPVAAGATVGDTAFTDRTIELTETDEEAVVSKATRVKEEVVINKAATDRVETIRDTVRHEDVEVTRDGRGAGTSTTAPRSAG
jgi:uncharacterized protein (TIGR02271 family)